MKRKRQFGLGLILLVFLTNCADRREDPKLAKRNLMIDYASSLKEAVTSAGIVSERHADTINTKTPIAGHPWRLKQPYPTASEMEENLGPADETKTYDGITVLIWQEKNPNGKYKKYIHATFNKSDGKLDELSTIFEEFRGHRSETVTRQEADWKKFAATE